MFLTRILKAKADILQLLAIICYFVGVGKGWPWVAALGGVGMVLSGCYSLWLWRKASKQ